MAACTRCQEIYHQFNPQDKEFLRWARCDNCSWIELLPENKNAWELYARVWNQVVTIGMGDVIGLNTLAVDRVMDIMGIQPEDRLELLDQVTVVHGIMFPIEKKKEKQPRAKKSEVDL